MQLGCFLGFFGNGSKYLAMQQNVKKGGKSFYFAMKKEMLLFQGFRSNLEQDAVYFFRFFW